jgi:P27 family predicted phage terminase small subunit
MSGAKGRSGGHNRLPTAIKLAQGTLRKDRVKRRAALASKPGADPAPRRLPKAPVWLPDSARPYYRKLGAHALQMNVIDATHAEALAVTAMALAEFVDADELVRREGMVINQETAAGHVVKVRHPACLIRDGAWRRVRDGLRAFGLTPADADHVREVPDRRESAEAKYFTPPPAGKLVQ